MNPIKCALTDSPWWAALAVVAVFKIIFGAVFLAEVSTQRPAVELADPAYVQIVDDPKLPRVLLIGDSVSLGYTLPLRRDLAGIANLHRPPANCGSTQTALRDLDKWLDGGKWDVIYFNWGLHDLSYEYDDHSNVNVEGVFAHPGNGGHQQVSPSEYEGNLHELIGLLRKTGATLIFATTTPVSADLHAYVKGSEIPYNKIAQRVMREEGVAVDDLWDFTSPQIGALQIPGNPHFTTRGYEVIAAHIATTIEKALRAQGSTKHASLQQR
jgi:acyl-CoA thioesterase-1